MGKSTNVDFFVLEVVMDEYIYIYRITCNNQCYVGQSNRKQDAKGARPYGRLEEHVKVG